MSLSVEMLAHYKAWANQRVFATVAALPEGEATKPRQTHFGNMVHTLNHVHVIDRIFQAHLEGRSHPYSSRNTPTHPPLQELWKSVTALDQWYIDYTASLDERQIAQDVHFHYVDGGEGVMTRGEIILHLVNHATYHRGFVGDMLNQVGVVPKATDLSVFLRDVWRLAPRG